MATQPKLDPDTEMLIDDLLASGRFAERAEVLCHGVRLAHNEECAEPLSAAEIAGIERGLADVAAGRLIPSSEVRAEMHRRFANRA